MNSLIKVFMISFFLVAIAFSNRTAGVKAAPVHEQDLSSFLNELFNKRNDLLIDSKQGTIEQYYLKEKTSKYALHHERNRSKYIQLWAEKRKIDFVEATGVIHIKRLKPLGSDLARVSLDHSLKLSYIYLNKILPPQSFGIGTRHEIMLKKMNGKWLVLREWYSDPLDENPKWIPETTDGLAPSVKMGEAAEKFDGKYNRKRAVAYATKYSGTAWGAGNNHRYNSKYLDYTGQGGDCTNFASQVIGDPVEGGGLPMFGGWRYLYSVGGKKTWVQTDAFKNFLLRSGYGTVVGRGRFTDVVKPTEKNAHGAISQLMPGDLIAYVIRGDVDHFSIVVGFDQNGYPLVNSHTADRYRVPFDLGWDKYTDYLLIHVKG
ncbi:amidase domain-containing protein [Paenibacillus sp. sgz302251]|uniref:amidase domain-containing protein n=1 Tax=Paenibacillus sp. sgz302251 TaxID=3414493 RepID=UPI003C7CEC96